MYLALFVVITVMVLVRSRGHFLPAEFVLSCHTNPTGWPSGVASVVGLVNPSSAFNALSAPVHLAEETPGPQTDISRAIFCAVGLGFVTSLLYAVALFFCIRNIDVLTRSRPEITEILRQELSSRTGTTFLDVLLVLTAVCCDMSTHTWQAH